MQKKILLVSSNRLGDCILYSGLIDYYKNTLKNTNLTMICGPVPGELFKYCDKIDKLIIIKKKKIFYALAKCLVKNLSYLLGWSCRL